MPTPVYTQRGMKRVSHYDAAIQAEYQIKMHRVRLHAVFSRLTKLSFECRNSCSVTITRRDVSVGDDLRREAGRTRDAKAARRTLGIACAMEGQSRDGTVDLLG